MIRSIAARLRPADPDDREAGFTIAEVLVAMMVFAVVSVGVAAGIVNALVLTNDSKARTVATHLANQAMDLERGKSDIFQVVSKSTTQTVGQIVYTTAVSATWADASGAIGNDRSISSASHGSGSLRSQVSRPGISDIVQFFELEAIKPRHDPGMAHYRRCGGGVGDGQRQGAVEHGEVVLVVLAVVGQEAHRLVA